MPSKSSPTFLHLEGHTARDGVVRLHFRLASGLRFGAFTRFGPILSVDLPHEFWLDEDVCAIANHAWARQERLEQEGVDPGASGTLPLF